VAYIRPDSTLRPRREGSVILDAAQHSSTARVTAPRAIRVNGRGAYRRPISPTSARRRTPAIAAAGPRRSRAGDPSRQSLCPRDSPRDGRTIRGRRLNEDAYTIQLVDEQSRLVSLVKADLRSLELAPASSMPSFQNTLTADERADLVAYLLSLKGREP
jgi:hypothetical protein